MKGIFTFFKKYFWEFFLFAVWTAVTVPNLKIYWMLLDDGWDIVYSRKIFENLAHFNFLGVFSLFLESVGRFRPVYWLYQVAVWVIGGNNYQFSHFAHMVVIGATVLFIYLIVKELTQSKPASFFAALFFLLIPSNVENILRLGPQEPLLSLMLSIVFYLFIKNKKNFLIAFVIVLTVFTKEISLAILPVICIYYLFARRVKFVKNKKQGLYAFIGICVSSLILILIALFRRGGYNSNYFFDLRMFIDNFYFFVKELSSNTLHFFPVLPVIYLLRNVILFFKRRKVVITRIDLFEFLFLIGFFSFLIIQLPWLYAVVRYLMPTILFFTIFSFLEIYQDITLLKDWKFIKRHRHFLYLVLFVVGIYVSVIWLLGAIFRETSSVSNYYVFRKLASYPKNTILLMNMKKGDSTIEYVEEVQIQLSEFWSRSDIKSEYLDLQNLPKENYVVVGTPQIPSTYTLEMLNKKFGNKITLINIDSKWLVLTTPQGFIKQVLKKLFFFGVRKEKFTTDGIYTYYYIYNDWYFFNE